MDRAVTGQGLLLIGQGARMVQLTQTAGQGRARCGARAPRAPEGLGLKRRASERDEAESGVCGEPAYRKKARIDLPGIWGAIARENEEQVRALLQEPDADFDFSAKDDEGLTPLVRAVKCGSRPMVELIWNAMPDTEANQTLQTAAFFAAVDAGNAEILGYMLGRQRDLVAERDKHGRTALHLACWTGQLGLVKLLLAHDASLLTQDPDGNTPLILAAMADEVFLLEPLRDSGANLQAVNKAGRNALTEAMLNGSCRVVEWLLSAGALGWYSPGEGKCFDALAVDLYESEASRAGLFSSQAEFDDQQVMRLPEDCAAWLKQLAKFLLPVKYGVCIVPEADISRLLTQIATGQGLMETTIGALSSYVGLCVALCAQKLSNGPSQGEQPPSVVRIASAQRDQVLAGLLAHLSAQPGEDRIRESGVSKYIQKRLTNRHGRQIDWLKAIGQSLWTAPCKKLGPDFAEQIINCISPEGKLLENKLRALLRRQFGLFEPVVDLTVDAIAKALERCPARMVDCSLFDSLGAMQEEVGGQYDRVPKELPAVLRCWDAELEAWQQDILQWRATSTSNGSRQALLGEWAQTECRYPVPSTFRASLLAGLRQLTQAGFDSHDAYLDLVFGQWRALRAALLQALDPDQAQASEPQAGTDEAQVSPPQTPPGPGLAPAALAAPAAAAARIYSAELGMVFTELGDGLELDL